MFDRKKISNFQVSPGGNQDLFVITGNTAIPTCRAVAAMVL